MMYADEQREIAEAEGLNREHMTRRDREARAYREIEEDTNGRENKAC